MENNIKYRLVKFEYTFRNGVKVEYYIDKDADRFNRHAIHSEIWKPERTKELIDSIHDQLVDDCLPKLYQHVSDTLNKEIEITINKRGVKVKRKFFPNGKMIILPN